MSVLYKIHLLYPNRIVHLNENATKQDYSLIYKWQVFK